ncbi:MAG: hypothetical protein ACYCOU_23690, partial [Sulfobacillus sp.]
MMGPGFPGPHPFAPDQTAQERRTTRGKQRDIGDPASLPSAAGPLLAWCVTVVQRIFIPLRVPHRRHGGLIWIAAVRLAIFEHAPESL